MINSHRDPKSHHPVSPWTPMDFDFGTVIEKALADNPKITPGGEGSTAQEWYDYGVQRWLQRPFTLEGRTVPIIMAPPMNAFSSYEKLLTDAGALPPGFQCKDLSTYPLPMVSVSSKAFKPRPGFNATIIRNVTFVDGVISHNVGNKYGATYLRYPKPVWIPYTIDIWALYKSHMAWLVQRLDECFAGSDLAHFKVETPFKAAQITAAKKVSVDDASELERDTSERLLRTTFSVDVEAWIWYDLLRASTVQSTTYAEAGEGEAVPDSIHVALVPTAPPRLEDKPPALEPSTDGV